MWLAAMAGYLYSYPLVADAPQGGPPKGGPHILKPALDRYCVTCHNETLKTAGLSLDRLDTTLVAKDTETWEKVARKLRTHEMPPPGLPRPDRATYEQLASTPGREELNYTVPRGGSTALLFAARSGDTESARLILAAGADVNDRLPDGASALLVSAHSGQRRVATLLLEAGANPNANDVGYTALHAAVLRSDLELVKALLAHGANPDSQIVKGTPVRRTSQDFELPKTLIGATPYLLAAKFLEADIMRALAAGGADTRTRMKDGATPLMAAAGMGIVAPAQDEKRGTDRRGLAILDGGIVEPESQVLDTVTAALSLGSDINAMNPTGESALHIASAQGYNTVVRTLVAGGADVNARTARGLTPLGALISRSGKSSARQSTIELLRTLGAQE
jgi:ankyrin repeat protein